MISVIGSGQMQLPRGGIWQVPLVQLAGKRQPALVHEAPSAAGATQVLLMQRPLPEQTGEVRNDLQGPPGGE